MVNWKFKYLKYKLKYNKLIAGSNRTQQCFKFYFQIYKEIKDIHESDKIIRIINTVITPELFNMCIGNLNFELPVSENVELSRTKLQIYNMNLNKLLNIDIDNDDLLYYKSMYNIPINIVGDIDENMIYSINQHIRNHIISQQDISNQYIYYNNLNDFSKKMYIMQKPDPNYLKIYRNKSYNNEEFKILSKLDGDFLTIFGNQELKRYDNDGNEMDRPFIHCFNTLFNIFEYSPPITKSFYVYRAEKIWNNITNLINEFIINSGRVYYRFNGFTSTSCDPRIGFSFNKLSSVTDDQRIIFKILIPEGSKIIIPSVYNDFDDPEFEILLGSDAIIRINNIIKDGTYKYLNSPTNEDNHNLKSTRNIKYFIEAEFLGYDNRIDEIYPNESVFTLQ